MVQGIQVSMPLMPLNDDEPDLRTLLAAIDHPVRRRENYHGKIPCPAVKRPRRWQASVASLSLKGVVIELGMELSTPRAIRSAKHLFA